MRVPPLTTGSPKNPLESAVYNVLKTQRLLLDFNIPKTTWQCSPSFQGISKCNNVRYQSRIDL